MKSILDMVIENLPSHVALCDCRAGGETFDMLPVDVHAISILRRMCPLHRFPYASLHGNYYLSQDTVDFHVRTLLNDLLFLVFVAYHTTLCWHEGQLELTWAGILLCSACLAMATCTTPETCSHGLLPALAQTHRSVAGT